MLNDTLKIVDCPGLVFPNIASSKEELILYGILSADNMRGFYEPIKKLLSLPVIEDIKKLYSVQIGCNSNNSDYPGAILDAIAIKKGFRTSNYGNPDRSRAARLLLKDFATNKLLANVLPPSSFK